MSRIELPDFALVLLFGDVANVAPGWFGGDAVCRPGEAGSRLLARTFCAVDATLFTKDELVGLGRAARDAYARVYAIAYRTDPDLATRRLASLAVMETFCVPKGGDAEVAFRPVATDRRDEAGPFDIIGDVHGCADELIELLGVLGYRVALTGEGDARRASVNAPTGRRAFFVGDLVDRGPNSPDVMRIVMAMVADGTALCVAGNHDVSFLRWLEGRTIQLKHGLDRTVAQFANQPRELRERARAFISELKGHLWVDGGALAVAHAGVGEGMIGRSSGRVRAFSLYGDTGPKPAADGLPTRYHWALDYAGPAAVVYGHTPVADAGWINNTLCIDTGCCFGGALTGLRWPEREIVSVPARAIYSPRSRPFGHPPPRPMVD